MAVRDGRALDLERLRLLAEAIGGLCDQLGDQAPILVEVRNELKAVAASNDRLTAALNDGWGALIRESFRAAIKSNPFATWSITITAGLAAVTSVVALLTLPATEATQVVGAALQHVFGITLPGGTTHGP